MSSTEGQRFVDSFRIEEHAVPLAVAVGRMAAAFSSTLLASFFVWLSLSGALPELLRSNKLASGDRTIGLALMGAGVVVALGLALWWRRRLARTVLLGRALQPLAALFALPLLVRWDAWQDRAIPFFVLVLAVGLWLAYSVRDAGPALRELLGRERVARWSSLPVPFGERAALTVVLAAAAFYACYFAAFTVLGHHNFYTRSYDLALEENIIWNIVHGGPFFKSSPLGGPDAVHFGSHATLFAYLIAIPYAVVPRSETILVLQALLVGGAAVPLYLVAKPRVGARTGALIAVLYLLYAPIHGALLYDFHYLTIGPFFLFGTLRALEVARARWLLLWVLVTLSVREDVAFSLCVLATHQFFVAPGKRRALTVAMAAFAYFCAMKFFVMPKFRDDEQAFLYMYKKMLPKGDDGFFGVLKTAFGNPGYTLQQILTEKKLAYVLHLFVPLLFYPLRRASTLILLVPGLLFTLLSTSRDAVVQPTFQYVMFWAPFLFIGLVHALEGPAATPSPEPEPAPDADGPRNADASSSARRAWIVAISCASLLASFQFGAILQRNTAIGGFHRFSFVTTKGNLQDRRSLEAVLVELPPDAKVVASETLVPQVAARENAYTLRFGIYDADYILAWARGGEKHVWEHLEDGSFGVVAHDGNVLLAKRGAPTDRNAELLRRVGRGSKPATADPAAEGFDVDDPGQGAW